MKPRDARFVGRFLATVALGCGSSPESPYSLNVGTDDGGLGSFGVGDAAATGALAARIEQNHVPVTVVILSCTVPCADVVAVATGGRAPYTFAWDDGSTNPARHVCLTSGRRLVVEVTDTSTSGELARAADTVRVPLTANVTACPDGGPFDSGTGGCDSVTNVSPSGTNPFGPWSYGSSASLGAAFTRYSQFLVSPSSNGVSFAGVDAWSSGVSGVDLNPAAYVNPSAMPLHLGAATWVVESGQFVLHPGLTGQYSTARWTAARSGAYDVRATFAGVDTAPTTTDVHVRHNGADVAAGNINVNGGGNTFSFSQTLTVVAGDAIGFAVGNGGNGYLNDSTGLYALVCPL